MNFPRVHRVGWAERSQIQDAGESLTDGLRDLILTRSAMGSHIRVSLRSNATSGSVHARVGRLQAVDRE